jgi:hypothetical protein
VSADPAAAPSGVVTFLFTDVEGSTRRWEADADRMRILAAGRVAKGKLGQQFNCEHARSCAVDRPAAFAKLRTIGAI